MANEKTVPTQLDIEHNNLDRAIRAVRDFQKGAATTAFTKNALKAIQAEDLATVALATRVPSGQLEKLRGS
ncbi:MAG: hypothetical protein [Arizlama microvirus]|nr:MAG: hypothetical protein [Arizlama microvirus]